MSDDHSFHLTPLDVRSQEFARTLRGYDRAQVDEFKQAISEELERLLRDRSQHEERLRNAQEQLRAFRDREARAEAERILERAHQEELLVRERADGVARQFTAYVASFRTLLERHLGEVDGLQRRVRPGTSASTDDTVPGQAE